MNAIARLVRPRRTGLCRYLSSSSCSSSSNSSSSSCFMSSSSSVRQDDDNDNDNKSLERGIVDVSDLAFEMRQSVREYTRHQSVKLVGILAHDGPFREDAELYSNFIATTCEMDGIDYEVQCVTKDDKQVEAAILDANHRSDVDGILVYYPIFKRRDSVTRGPYKNQMTGVYYKSYDDYLRDLVSSEKDVEGLCDTYNARWLFRAQKDIPPASTSSLTSLGGQNVVYPCTALSVFKILESLQHQGQQLKDSTITIINRSEILGRPLATILATHGGANVYSVDANSVLLFRPGGRLSRVSKMPLRKCIQASSIVVTGVPSPTFTLPCQFINPGSIVVNVSEYNNVPEDDVIQIPNLRYVPNVGKVTIAALEQNLIHLHRLRHVDSWNVSKER